MRREDLNDQGGLDDLIDRDYELQRHLDAEERRLERGDAYTERIRPARPADPASARDVIAVGIVVVGAGASLMIALLSLIVLVAVTT